MAQKVFILSNVGDGTINDADSAIISYWGSLEQSIKFIAYGSYLERLCDPTGYLAIKVLKMKNKNKVDVRWISFNISRIMLIKLNPFAAHYFIITKEALGQLLEIDVNTNSLGVEIGKKEENGKTIYSILIGVGTFLYNGGVGGNGPTTGAKLP